MVMCTPRWYIPLHTARDYDITLSPKSFSPPADRVLIVDDFLANGKAMKGLLDVCRQAGAQVAGIGICIEKGFQPGGEELRRAGYKLASLAIVDHMDDHSLTLSQAGLIPAHLLHNSIAWCRIRLIQTILLVEWELWLTKSFPIF